MNDKLISLALFVALMQSSQMCIIMWPQCLNRKINVCPLGYSKMSYGQHCNCLSLLDKHWVVNSRLSVLVI